jgi:glycosyltransferase involved in cell wall biosynthesis
LKRVAVITTFVDLLEAFSLCGVVESQLKALLAAGYYTTFVACDGCRPRDVFANPLLRQWRLPHYHVDHEAAVVEQPHAFREGVEAIKARLHPLLGTIDVAITHDIIYLPHHLAFNVACRELAPEFPHLRWLHWIHSAPEQPRCFPDTDPRCARFTPFPQSLLVYPNAYDVPRVAKQFSVAEKDVAVVPHALDYDKAFEFHPLTKALIHRFRLYDPGVFAIYPIRMDRGKQPEKLVRLFAEIKRLDQSIRLLIINFHSTGQHFLDYRDSIVQEARTLGLTDEEVVFTNQLTDLPDIPDEDMQRYRVEFPHKVILDLFHLTNVYVHPSGSETYSLVCQEAAACGNLLVLNDDFPPMREVYGPAALYVKFSSNLFTTTHRPSEQAYYAEIARKIRYLLDSEKTIQHKTRLRLTRNLGTVFHSYVEPLLYVD